MHGSTSANRVTANHWTIHLRRAGLRVTRPRRLVLEALREIRGHRSADDLVLALRKRRTPLGRTSVYNVVSDLTSCGLLTLTEVGSGSARYELTEQRHHHFVCRRCGKILDVPCISGREPCLKLRRFAGQVDEAQVILRGTCPECLTVARASRKSRANRAR